MDSDTSRSREKETEFLAAETARRFILEVEELMERRRITKAELARRMGISRARVTSLLNGRGNLTIRSMTAIAHALGRRPVIGLRRLPPSLPEGFVA
jgi:transcriptional regulator with XRE-family HTH domain